MLTNWQEILPSAIDDLTPLHRDIVMHVMGLPGKRKPAYSVAKGKWGLGREAFDAEMGDAFSAIRQQLKRYFLKSSSDLEF